MHILLGLALVPAALLGLLICLWVLAMACGAISIALRGTWRFLTAEADDLSITGNVVRLGLVAGLATGGFYFCRATGFLM